MRGSRLVLVSSLLFTLSFPLALNSENLIPASLSSFFIWFAYVPLALATFRRTPRESFRLGYLFGLLTNLGTLFWIIIAIKKYGGLSMGTSSLIFFLILVVLGFFPAVSLWATARLGSMAPRWLLATLLFTLWAWTQTFIPLGGFPWLHPAYALYGAPHLAQTVDLFGTTGLNFLIFLVNFVLAEGCLWMQKREPAYPKWGALFAAMLLVSGYVYGLYRTQQIQTGSPDGHLKVALVQGNVPQDLKWSSHSRTTIRDRYEKLSRLATESAPDLIVWPEAALPYSVAGDTQKLSAIARLEAKADFVVGAPTRHRREKRTVYRNSVFVVDHKGRVKSRYDKIHLVPFGEYVPLGDVLPMQYVVPAVAGVFRAGDRSILGKTGGSRFGILVCYEVLFSDLTIDLVRDGAQFLVNVTNDAWFDHTSGPYQHVRFASFRAIETRRPLVRSANTGITAWFDPLGRIHNPSKLFTEAMILAEIKPRNDMTFYIRYPFFFPLAVASLLLLTATGLFRARTRGGSIV